jgi:hypothetical protein
MHWPLTDCFIDVLALALRILLHSKARFLFTSVGIGAAFFLTAALTGLLVGWCDRQPRRADPRLPPEPRRE